MATISSLGTGSGLDLSGMLTKLMSVEQQPLTALDTKEASYQAQLSAYGTLKSAVSALQGTSDTLASSSLFNSNTLTSSATGVVTGTASSAAKAGSYSLKVTQLAQAQTLASATFASLTSPVNGAAAGKLKIELGTYDSGTNTFTDNPNRNTASVDVAANASLSDIRDAINNANAGVTAAIVSVGTAGYKLTLTSQITGAANSIKLTTIDANGKAVNNNSGLAQLSFDPTATAGSGKEFAVTTEALDSNFQLNGIALTRSSNVVSDAITGVTLNLAGTGTSSLSIQQDTTGISTALSSFVKAYNDLHTQLKSLTTYDATNKKASTLTGDSTARTLETTLKNLLTTRVDTGVPTISSLSSVGVSVQKDGSLTLDASKLSNALATSPDAVKTLFSAKSSATSAVQGIASKMSATFTSMLADTGLFASKTNGINTSIKSIDSQRTELNLRLTQIEANYRAQFTALDTTVSKMQATSNYLTQQLNSLSSSSSSSGTKVG